MNKKLLLIFIALITLSAYQLVQKSAMLNSFSGNFKNENIEIDMMSDAQNPFGVLHINSRTYPIDGTLVSSRRIEGEIDIGDKQLPFSLSLPLWRLLLPTEIGYPTFSLDDKSYQLKHTPFPNPDLSGSWRSLNSTLWIQRAENNTWVGLHKGQNIEKTLLSFKVNGTTIQGAYGDSNIRSISGVYLEDLHQLVMTIEDTPYKFTNRNNLNDKNKTLGTTRDLMQAYDGEYTADQERIYLRISYRRRSKPDDDGIINSCTGLFKYYDVNSEILSCGVEDNKLWFNFRKYNDFALAEIALTDNGVTLTAPNAFTHELVREIKPMLAGRYRTEKGTIFELVNLTGNFWDGYIYALDGAIYPFKARVTANRLEGVNIYKNDRYERFIIHSEITTAVLQWNDEKPTKLNLISKSPIQPHPREQLKIIEQAYVAK